MFPRKFGRYIEIFGGSGAVLLGKEPSKFEVYNDIEGELVNFFRVVKNRPAELLLELDLLPLNSREEFSSWLHFHDGGNTVTVTNLWETLNYKVSEVRVISPNDVEAILIQPGHELLTLLTCHPPASGGKQRYLVFCERTYL